MLHGQGEMHLQTTVEHIARDYGLKLATHKPAVAYKETIRKAVNEHGRLKRQTGGHGQFADVKIDITPLKRGEGFQFIDKVVGGAVPRNYHPLRRRGGRGGNAQGAVRLSGGGCLGDAGGRRIPFRGQLGHGVQDRDPVGDEGRPGESRSGAAGAGGPCDGRVPNEYTARAQRLLTGRRGQILGFAEREGWPGWDEVQALVPEAEMHDLIIELRSQTMGLGTYPQEIRPSGGDAAKAELGKTGREGRAIAPP